MAMIDTNYLNALASYGGLKGPTSLLGRSTSVNALFGAVGEQTSARVASIASRGLDDPASLTFEEIRTVCGSALTQTANKK